MKRALILASCLIAALALATAATADTATIAKKKKTYCQKQGASAKAKLSAKSHGFYLYKEKGNASVLICQDRPKFFASFGTDLGAKYSQLRVSPKKCAIFTSKPPNQNPEVYAFNFSDFTAKPPNGQGSIYIVGYQQPSATLIETSLSTNCVAGYGMRINGIPQVAVEGTSAFGYTGTIYPKVGANMTDKELAGVKVTGTGTGASDTATLSWTESGVKHTYVYLNSAQSAYPAPTT
jgi:hypothetical protein